MIPYKHIRSFCLLVTLIICSIVAYADDTLSEASKRAIRRGYEKISSDSHIHFKQSSLKGDLSFEEGMIRRDPSAVLLIEDLYHVWYTKGKAEFVGFGSSNPNDKVYPWDLTEIWHATSKDGWNWQEKEVAIQRGPAGAYDDRAVFTPEILCHQDKFYMVYQTVKAPYLSRTKNQVGMSVADSPYGPWRKLKKPILSPTNNGAWKGEVNDRNLYSERGDFDSLKVHDPTLMHFDGRFWLYYKGQRIGEQLTFAGREINHGVAIADKVEGPYIKSMYNPISNSGHEIAVWHYRGGIASLLTTDGPERNTIQWSPDGINFFIKARLKTPPVALGIYRPQNLLENDSLPAGLQWGLAHKLDFSRGDSIVRYEPYRPIMKDPGFRNTK